MKKLINKKAQIFLTLFNTSRTVDFIICGTQKGGTSALDAYLREHPEISMADRKEVHFFDNDNYFSNGKPDYSKYHSWFTNSPSHKLLGEATPIYMYWRDSPKRIWEYNPNMKLIALLRNPIERAYSHWNMERSRNTDNYSFWNAIKNEEERCREAQPKQHRVYSYIDRGFYLEQLRRLWTYFPKDRVLIMKSEDLKQKPDETLNQICSFLKVSKFKSVVPRNIFSLPYESSMKEIERDYLRSIFKPEIKELETVLKWDCGQWLAR